MTAFVLRKSQKASSDLSHLAKKINEHAVATRRVSMILQPGRSCGQGTGNTSQKKSGDMVQRRSSVFLRKSFLGHASGWGRNQ